jgi:hypothetical protein
VAEDVGHDVTYSVTATAPDYAANTQTAPAVRVEPGVIAITMKAVKGTAQVGHQIGADFTYAWYDYLTTRPTFTYQWLRDGAAISGATEGVYNVVAADSGHSLAVRVTAALTGYTTATATSDAVVIQAGDSLAIESVTIPDGLMVGYQAQAAASYSRPADSTPTTAWQWLRDGQPIAGATANTYVVTQADNGTTLSARFTLSLDGYTTVTRDSNSVVIGASVTNVVVGGTAKTWQTLGVSYTAPTDATHTVQWLRNGQPIAGATGDSYAVQGSDAGQSITYHIVFTMNGTTIADVTPTAVVIAKSAIELESVSISSPLSVGDSPTAGHGVVRSPAAAPAPTYSWQWLRDGAPIAGATSDTYTITSADKGKQLSVQLTVSADGCESATQTSNVVTVDGRPLTINIKSIQGTVEAGQQIYPELEATAGATLTYQWLSDGQPIAGATTAAYLIQDADKGHYLSLRVTGTLAGYDDTVVTSKDVLVPGADPSFQAIIQSIIKMLMDWIQQILALFGTFATAA